MSNYPTSSSEAKSTGHSAIAARGAAGPGGMEELIGVINDLQMAFSRLQVSEREMNLDLPRIAVVGAQSSGKSSVLESFVGKDFLPRGSGIVTRCPLVLQLIHSAPGTKEVATFSHITEEFTDFALVSAEITRRTQQLAGNLVVCESPIMLKVTSPHVLTLTLVDLPGLVFNVTAGQPESIVKSINQMIKSFITPDNTIILAISSAAEDVANSRSLDMARQVDREGKRTIGVLTKLDLMDPGTDALPTLNNETLRLKHGFVGVVNRGQKDLNENTTPDSARAKEKEFFTNHVAYSAIAHRSGSSYLASKLNAMLLTHIQQCLPGLKAHVDDLLNNTRKKQHQLGMDQPQMEHGAQLLNLLHKFDETFKSNLGGDFDEIPRGELVGGARIKAIFNENFTPFILQMRASSQLTDEDIRTRIRSSSGFQASFYPPEKVVWTLAKLQIKRFEEPSRQCVGYVHDELHSILERSAEQLARFPTLKAKVLDASYDLLHKLRGPTVDHIMTMIAAEQSYINVNHPTLIAARQQGRERDQQEAQNAANPQQQGQAPQGGRGGKQPGQPQQAQQPQRPAQRGGDNFSMPMGTMSQGDMSSEEKREIEGIRELVEVYFGITKGTMCDQVPKIVVCLMLAKLREQIIQTLMRHLYCDGDAAATLLAESPDIANQRRAVTSMLKCLTTAQEVLNRVRDYHFKSQ